MLRTISPEPLVADAPSRLLPARQGWWFVSEGGSAKLLPAQVDADGTVAPATLDRLREQGLLRKRPPSTYSLTVLTSTDCNLGCGYCFQNIAQDPRGGSRPPRIEHARLKPDTTSAILDFTRARMAEAKLDKLAVMLFGGEPLLNLRGAVDLLERAAELGKLTVSMVSNGTLLTPLVVRTLNAAGLGSVQLTFDGDRDEHDAIRVTRSGGPTFDKIVDNAAQAMSAASVRWHLRVNVSHHNRHGMDALVQRLADRLDVTQCTIQFALIGDVGVGYGNELAYGGALAAEFTRWHRAAQERGFSLTRPRSGKGCQACEHPDGQYGAVVSADGSLASCWETAGRPEWVVGDVDGGYLSGEHIADRWITCTDQYRHGEHAAELAAFQDEVDAELLDLLHPAGDR
ncbi:radical SAM protein [Catenulispora sp. NF23]|uniref:Radical SAM protein n=1 Tax=Catenulispora pinistramenti TaxID=2705254 RepID=A0ABS5L2D4_9ACTN|nr:radical SAM protein [Catenulispora pinistramenti]MBS2535982.1 radical SAM protein [Catenulispora pinistramenti]MBS2552451.1 radical SAM protein [Catenulispora pinistramenti]